MKQLTPPLISCIMPTNNRRAFVPYAITYFLQQDYENKELLIADDGTDSIEDIVPAYEQIRYVRLHKKMTLGEKRNYCIKESKGDFIMHWDDDDWMAPYRISYQVEELLKHDAEVCGLQQMLFRELATGKCWLYKYPPLAQPWLAGGSLLYTRSFWQQSPFPDMQVASDTRFIFARKLTSFVALTDYHFYVASIHAKNTSAKNTGSSLWQSVDNAVVKKIMGDDWEDYTNATKGKKEVLKAAINGKPIIKNNTVTACLLSYKRPENMQVIINSIHSFDFIDEILVWNNDPSHRLSLTGSKVKVIESDVNMICYGRFLCARQSRNERIYFQDDDAIVNNITDLYTAFIKDDTRISHALSQNHYAVREKYIYSSGQVAFLGWGSFIRKEWISVLDHYLKDHACDYLFLREADKFFTLLLGKQNNTMLANIQLLQYDSTPGVALYLEKEHSYYVALAIRQALEFNRKSRKIIYPITWNVVITCSNYGHFLKDAVNSVLNNHSDYVITIVDDGSTDNTVDICLELTKKYPFIKSFRNEQKMGTSFARNKGAAAVDSIFVVFLDADDKIGPEYLFEAEKLLRKGFDVVNPDAILFGDVISRWPVPEMVSLKMQLNKNHVHCCSALRRSYWAEVGGYDENINSWEDYEFWIRIAEAGARIKKLPGNHFYYRQHNVSKSSALKSNGQNPEEYIKFKHKSLYEALG